MIMTQYTDKVERVRNKQAAEKWGKSISYIHANDGVIETKFNNGDIKYDTRQKNGKYKTHWHKENQSQTSLIENWWRALADSSRIR
tara:strand:- start:236 stop:493 length:258 start_codon:yes stop_codon:yes gene_type:complete